MIYDFTTKSFLINQHNKRTTDKLCSTGATNSLEPYPKQARRAINMPPNDNYILQLAGNNHNQTYNYHHHWRDPKSFIYILFRCVSLQVLRQLFSWLWHNSPSPFSCNCNFPGNQWIRFIDISSWLRRYSILGKLAWNVWNANLNSTLLLAPTTNLHFFFSLSCRFKSVTSSEQFEVSL